MQADQKDTNEMDVLVSNYYFLGKPNLHLNTNTKINCFDYLPICWTLLTSLRSDNLCLKYQNRQYDVEYEHFIQFWKHHDYVVNLSFFPLWSMR